MEKGVLQDFGLTANEAAVYLALLELGKSSVSEIAAKTNLHRRTIYDCILRLADKGLVGSFTQNKTTYYSAVDPRKLLELLREKEERMKKALPSLLKLAKKNVEKFNATIFTGKEGLKTVCEDVIKTRPKELLSLHTSGETPLSVLPYYIPQFHKKRIHSKIHYRGIFHSDEVSAERIKELKQMPFTKVKIFPSKAIVPISIWLYANKTALMAWDSEFAVLLEGKKITGSFREHFEAMWKIAKG